MDACSFRWLCRLFLDPAASGVFIVEGQASLSHRTAWYKTLFWQTVQVRLIGYMYHLAPAELAGPSLGDVGRPRR
jgi:hypothetical protein